MRKRIVLIAALLMSLGARADLNSLGSYVWQASDEPKVFNYKLQLSFVSGSQAFPNYGSVLAGGGYTTNQDGGVFQLYFPYGEQNGGTAPKVRLGLYNNLGWSDWETFFTSANANLSSVDWNVRDLIAAGNVGIGTISPASDLHVQGTGAEIRLKADVVNQSNSGAIVFDEGNGSDHMRLEYDGQAGAGGGRLLFKALGGVEIMAIERLGNVGIGTTTPSNKLEVNGTIRSKEVIVESTGWPDYVFKDGYVLPSLSAVETHIEENGHLPGIEPASAVNEGGQSLGAMQREMMQKIEELTLYMIQKDKQIESLIGKNEKLEFRLADLERDRR